MTYARRPQLGAHIRGPAAVWLLRGIRDGAEADAVAHFQRVGRPDVAAVIADAMAQLREAARQWEAAVRADGASVDGSAEAGSTEAGGGSSQLGGRPPGGSEVVDTATAAGRLGVSERRVRQLLADGPLTGRKVGRQWLVERTSITEYQAMRRTAG